MHDNLEDTDDWGELCPDADFTLEVRCKRDKLLATNLITALAIGFVNASLFAVFIASEYLNIWLGAWYLGLIAVTAARVPFALSVLKNDKPFTKFDEYVIIALTAMSGALWGAPVLFLPAGAGPTIEDFALFLAAGMTAAAALSYATHFKVVLWFNLPTLAVVLTNYALKGDPIALAMCGILCLYFSATMVMARRTGETIDSALHNEAEAARRQVELEQRKKELHHEIATRADTENRLKYTLLQARNFNTVLERLYKQYISVSDYSPNLIPELNEQISLAMGVERVSIWFFSKDYEQLICEDLFEATAKKHSDGLSLEAETYPAYFNALNENRVIVANDARTDPHTFEFRENYLEPLGIASMIDAPLRGADGVQGAICCESVGERRDWTTDEIAFIASVAQFISVSLLMDESNKLASALQEALIESEKANKTKSAFLTTMSHEIRTPMNGVLGAAALLNKFELEPEMKSYVEIINDSGVTLMTLLNDILDLSKLESGKLQLESTPFDLRDVIQKIEPVHALKAREKGIRFTIDIENDLSLTRIGDPHRLTQIFHNLISNAIKFTEEGFVHVTVSDFNEPGDDASWVSIKVSDTGIGMSDDEAANMFKPFLQADNSTTRKYGGTGLGMSIVKNILDEMGGRVFVDSEKSVGTTFTVRLPLKIDSTPVAKEEPDKNAESIPAFNDISILVAEDNQTNTLIMKAFLRSAGVTTTFVENGKEAVQAFKSGKFNLVLMDIQMPIMDGVQAYQEIRKFEAEENKRRTPIIAVTANAMHHQVKHYLNIGFDDYLPKPVNEKALIKVMNENIITPIKTDITDVA